MQQIYVQFRQLYNEKVSFCGKYRFKHNNLII